MMPALSPNAWLRFDLIQRILANLDVGSVVEVGTGKGALAARLASRYDYVGYEPDAVSFSAAAGHLESLGAGTVINSLLPSEPVRAFGCLVACEVLEHIENDADTLASWVRWVRPGGHVLLSVPAHPERFGPGDVAVGHVRRYTRAGLASRMVAAGVDNVAIYAYGFPLGYGLEWGRNVLSRRPGGVSARELTASSGRRLQPREWMGVLTRAATFPFRLIQMPFRGTELGTGYVAVGRRTA